MCLTTSPKETAAFRYENRGKKTITCWKVLKWCSSERTKSGYRLESVFNYTDIGWKPDKWYKADKVRSRLDTKAKLRVYPYLKYSVYNGIHVCTTKEQVKYLKESLNRSCLGISYGVLVIVPVEVKIKDLVAAGGFNGEAVFKEAKILKKNFPKKT